ncbi:hypothetical protein BDY19DRAFT_918979 [Irpex rosettiformis]|uniref:Uncharacterized protein n=1 Tax=Irpex rosettiformis TaxID=378272 RepID=A0ACB8UHN1_9APHY|nr:hypothetical protein BDY19DRAFT_918979 [Irpex rosettiformis]
MSGRKRVAESESEAPATRSKVAKTDNSNIPRVKGGKKGPKMGANTFKSRALPLHVNITHTPPVIGDDDTKDVAQTDPGFIGSTALIPSSFNTGSYGWKGNKRITVELSNSKTGEKEKVQVMLTINATVLGSKNAEDDTAEQGEEKSAGRDVAQEAEIEAEKEDPAEESTKA